MKKSAQTTLLSFILALLTLFATVIPIFANATDLDDTQDITVTQLPDIHILASNSNESMSQIHEPFESVEMVSAVGNAMYALTATDCSSSGLRQITTQITTLTTASFITNYYKNTKNAKQIRACLKKGGDCAKATK